MADIDAGDSPRPAAEEPRLHVEQLSSADGVVAFKVSGQLDISTERLLRERLQPAIMKSPVKIVLEASKLTFMDSSGLAVLLVTARHVPTVELRNPTKIVRRLITIAGLQGNLSMVPDA